MVFIHHFRKIMNTDKEIGLESKTKFVTLIVISHLCFRYQTVKFEILYIKRIECQINIDKAILKTISLQFKNPMTQTLFKHFFRSLYQIFVRKNKHVNLKKIPPTYPWLKVWIS